MAASVLDAILDLPESPRALALAAAAGEPIANVLGPLVLFLRYAKRFGSERGLIEHATHETLAATCGRPAEFWATAEKLGWFKATEAGLMLAAEERRWFAKLSEARSKNRARQAKFRAGRDVDCVTRDKRVSNALVTRDTTEPHIPPTTYADEPVPGKGEEGEGGVGARGIESAVLGENPEAQRRTESAVLGKDFVLSNEEEPINHTPRSARAPAKKKPPKPKPTADIPAELDVLDFRVAWAEWLKHYAEKKKSPPTVLSQYRQLKEMAEWTVERAIAAIRYSIKRDWTAVFEQKDCGPSVGRPAPPQRRGVDIEKVLPLQGGAQ